MPFSLHDKVTELRKEMGFRRRVYGQRKLENPKLAAELDRREAIMGEILAEYEDQLARQRPTLDFGGEGRRLTPYEEQRYRAARELGRDNG
jgi:hypothetical protein